MTRPARKTPPLGVSEVTAREVSLALERLHQRARLYLTLARDIDCGRPPRRRNGAGGLP